MSSFEAIVLTAASFVLPAFIFAVLGVEHPPTTLYIVMIFIFAALFAGAHSDGRRRR